MITVPGGVFFMGCNQEVDSECHLSEKPGRTVDVAAFSIDRTEVTIAAYRQCVGAARCSKEGLTGDKWSWDECNWGKADHDRYPINCITWEMALTYCQWAGKRLPTEAEWEKAARGTDGRKYPWGNTGYGSGAKVANIADESAKSYFVVPSITVVDGYDDGWALSAPVASFPAGVSPYGALDMIGNVWEWTNDWSVHTGHVVRGGSFRDEPQFDRVSARVATAEPGTADIGFRCVR